MINDKIFGWFLFAFGYLCYYTYKDLANNMTVDDRYNFFMSGLTFGLYFVIDVKFWYIFVTITSISIFSQIMKKFKLIGEADINSLYWLFIGFAVIGVKYFVIFVGTFLFLTIIYYGVKWIIAKKRKLDVNTPVPFYPVLLGSYILAVWQMLAL